MSQLIVERYSYPTQQAWRHGEAGFHECDQSAVANRDNWQGNAWRCREIGASIPWVACRRRSRFECGNPGWQSECPQPDWLGGGQCRSPTQPHPMLCRYRCRERIACQQWLLRRANVCLVCLLQHAVGCVAAAITVNHRLRYGLALI